MLLILILYLSLSDSDVLYVRLVISESFQAKKNVLFSNMSKLDDMLPFLCR